MANDAAISTPPLLTAATAKRALARRLLAWFRRHQRDLPWRQSSDPYRIWVSEIMLQQTQVATVIPYFTRFIKAFPDPRALASADEQQVLRLWEGLGYYRRARQMHRAAQVLVDAHQGRFPRDLEAVRNLPGIGRYTAGAIVSIAFDTATPILEANTVRLLSRLTAFAGDVASTAGQKFLWQVAEDVLPARGCGEFNQALMELGSLVCTPRAPACDRCPLVPCCQAFQSGQQAAIPRPKAKVVFEAVQEATVAVRHKDKLLLRRCAAGERWAGLWDFLRFRLAAQSASAAHVEIRDKVRALANAAIDDVERLSVLKHGVTRFRITLDCYVARLRGARPKLPAGEWRWVSVDALSDLPLSTTGRKFSRLLQAREQ